MTLPHTTLERLLQKEQWLEARWLQEGALAFIQTGERATLCVLTREKLQRLIAPAAIGCSLEPQGASFAAQGQQLWALTKEPYSLALWSLCELSEPPELWPLDGPATGLSLDPRGRWVAWFQNTASGEYLLCRRDSNGQHHQQALPAGQIPYGLAWHPHQDLALLILNPSSQCPWHAAKLNLAAFCSNETGFHWIDWKDLAPPHSSAICLEAEWSPCGQKIFGLWQSGECFQLWSYNLIAATWQQLTHDTREKASARRRMDTRSFTWNEPRQEFLTIVQERGFFELQSLSYPEGSVSHYHWPEYTALSQLSLTPDGQELALVGSSSKKPPTQLVLRPKQHSWALDLQRSLLPPDSIPGLVPELVSWPSFDGELIYGILYRDPKKKGPQPLLMPIHGGPCEQVLADWPIKAQAFVEQGYTVLYVNYRGSWGFGKSYQESLAGRWGELELADIASALLTLSARGWIDPQRVALWGGDIGASTVLHLLQKFPKVFQAAIVVYPLLELDDYWQRTTQLKRAELNWALGGDDPMLRTQKSPMRGIGQIETPLAVFHGAQDSLVPSKHIERLVDSLQERNIPVWYTCYPDEKHSWQSRTTLEDYYCKVASFLARFMRKTRSSN